MNKLDRLLKVYSDWVSLPWPDQLPTQQRVWCVVYDPVLERPLRPKIGEFRAATTSAGHDWTELVEIAVERGACAVLMPVSARRMLLDLSDDMATRIDVQFYADSRDALLKALNG